MRTVRFLPDGLTVPVPAGICGNGLLDIVAGLVRRDVITSVGEFLPNVARFPAKLRERLGRLEGKPVFVLNEKVYLGRGDIRQAQLAKGAIRAGIEFLLQHAGIAAVGVEQVLIAGSFGYHRGQAFFLIHGCRAGMERLMSKVEVVELATGEGFEKVFVSCPGF